MRIDIKQLIKYLIAFIFACVSLYYCFSLDVQAKDFEPPFQTIPKPDLSGSISTISLYPYTDLNLDNYIPVDYSVGTSPSNFSFYCPASESSVSLSFSNKITMVCGTKSKSETFDTFIFPRLNASLYPDYYYIFSFDVKTDKSSNLKDSWIIDTYFKPSEYENTFSTDVFNKSGIYYNDIGSNAGWFHFHHVYFKFSVNSAVENFALSWLNSSFQSFNLNYIIFENFRLYRSNEKIDIMAQNENRDLIIDNQDNNSWQIQQNDNNNRDLIIDNQNENAQKEIENENKNHKETMDTIKDADSSGATDSAGSFFTGFKSNEHGLTSIITSPLTLIKSITSQKCSNLALDVPFLKENNKINLPCMSEIYSKHFGVFLDIYQTITFGIVAYWVCIKCYAMVKGFQNPDDDKVEVMDL